MARCWLPQYMAQFASPPAPPRDVQRPLYRELRETIALSRATAGEHGSQWTVSSIGAKTYGKPQDFLRSHPWPANL